MVGLVAGGGQFPFILARQAREMGFRVGAVGFSGFTDPGLAAEVDIWQELAMGQLNKLITFFKKNDIKRLTLAGSIEKPKAIQVRPDFRTVRILLSMKNNGDDALLRTLIAELESEGLEVLQPADLVPGLRAPQGILGACKPSVEQWDDLRLAYQVLKTIGPLDIGQCVVVKDGIVAAVEAIEGTDAAIRRGAGLGGEGCVVLKMLKAGQDQRIDLPSLGLQTVELMKEVKASCLGFEAGRTLFFDLNEAVKQADAAGISLVGLNGQEFEPRD